MSEEVKRTPLYEQHVKAGGKMVSFAGYELPVRYSDVAEEHRTVRSHAGLFDVSHMGEFLVRGPEAEQALQYLTCNDVSSLVEGRAHYTAIINHDGGVVDDIIIYKRGEQDFLLCVNAANRFKDFTWLTEHNKHDAEFLDVSDEYAQVAIQGPQAETIVQVFFADDALASLKPFWFKEVKHESHDLIIARTGYTGEDGFEIFAPPSYAAELWSGLLEAGKPHGLIPAGLGARDSLRLEACYPLHGHELSDTISAIESGLGWIVKLKKGDFIGRQVLEKHKTEGAPRTLVGFFVEGKGIVREEASIESSEGQTIGVVTSGTRTPTIDRALGLALVDSSYAAPGTSWNALVRNRAIACTVVKKPFYKRS